MKTSLSILIAALVVTACGSPSDVPQDASDCAASPDADPDAAAPDPDAGQDERLHATRGAWVLHVPACDEAIGFTLALDGELVILESPDMDAAGVRLYLAGADLLVRNDVGAWHIVLRDDGTNARALVDLVTPTCEGHGEATVLERVRL